MTEINHELERIAAESFYDDDTLDEATDTLDTKGDPRAPMKGAAPAQKEGKISNVTPGGETQDMGPAVVSPDAPSDPGIAAEKKAKKATPPGKAGGKGLASAASGKTVAPTGMDGEVGDKMRGEGVDPEEHGLAAARKAEKKKAGKGGGTEGRPQIEPDEDEGKQDDEDEDDEEEATRSKKKPTAEDITVDQRVAAMDLSDDVKALTGGEGLSEEFKQKAATIFEAAVKAKIKAELERLEEEYAEAFEQSMTEAKGELTEKVDNYLKYVVEEWMKKNEMALEHKLKAEIAESFIADLRGLFEKHDITIPDDQFDLLDAAASKADDMEEKLNEEMQKNITMTQRINELEQHEILLDVASDLADTEVEKFAELAENVDYESADNYRTKLETIKDSYFPKAQVTEDGQAAPDEDAYDEKDVTNTMAAYMTAIGKGEARAVGTQS